VPFARGRGLILVIVRNATREGILLGDKVLVANTSQTRRTGLLKHESLPEGEGLWIAPCEGVHTRGMKFSIDVLFLSKARKVLKIREDMGKRRIALCLWAHSTLELPAGTVARTGTLKGDQLEFER